MAERYTKISESRDLQYAEGTPVVLSASALLADNKNKSLILQLKFRNIEDRIISSLKVAVDGSDAFNTDLFKDFEYQYLDMNAGRGDEFGSKNPVVLPEKDTRNYRIKIMSVGFADGEVMNLNADFVKLPETEEITSVLSQKGVERYRTFYGADKKVIPLQFKDIWMCGCGTINKNTGDVCCSCGKSFAELKEGLDETLLTYKTAAELAKRESERAYRDAAELLKEIPEYRNASELCEEYLNKAEVMRKDTVYQTADSFSSQDTIDGYRAANTEFESIKDWKDSAERIEKNNQRIAEIQAEEEEKERLRKKAAKKRTITIVSILAVAALITLYFTYIKPETERSNAYNAASQLLEDGQYDEAAEAYTALGDYKDSKEMVLESHYRKAQSHYDNKEYEKAIAIWSEMPDYSDSKEKIELAQNDWNEEKYQKALAHIENGEYYDATKFLSQLGSYKDSAELLKSATYSLALSQLEQGEYRGAIKNLEKVKGYEDADEKILEAKYGYVDTYRSSSKQSTYYEYIRELVNLNYEGAQNIYDEVYAWKVVIKAINDDGSYKNMSSVSRYGKVYFIIDVSGGEPDKSIRIRIDSKLPGTEIRSDYQTAKDGNVYTHSLCVDGGAGSGTAWIKIYDEDGNYLTEGSIAMN